MPESQTPQCLLIVPPFQSGEGSILKSFDYTMPHLGLLFIAAWLREQHIGVSLLDFTVEDNRRYSVEDILKAHIVDHGIPQWIGISVCTPAAPVSYRVAGECRKLFPESQIVLGGPHVTVLGDRVFDECAYADYLVAGEGEYTLAGLIKDPSMQAPNLLKRGSHHQQLMGEPNPVDPAIMPMPAYDLLKFDRYVPPPASLKSKHPGIGIITTRGCPYKCTFCTKISGSKLRLIPVSKIIEQLKYLKATYGIKQFHFYDDTISCKREHIIGLCRAILDEELNIHWSCFARVDTVDEEVLLLMKQAGCFVIMYGVESMDERVLDSFNKGINVSQIKTALELTRKSGIESRISLIIGMPAETKESLQKTKREVLRLKTDFLQVFIAVPMPGSQFYTEARAEGRVISENWADYNLSKVLYRHPLFTENELFRWQRKFYLSFYLRPLVVIRLILKINSWTALRNVWTGFRGFLKIVK